MPTVTNTRPAAIKTTEDNNTLTTKATSTAAKHLIVLTVTNARSAAFEVPAEHNATLINKAMTAVVEPQLLTQDPLQ